MSNCPHCDQIIDDWYWVRFEGIGSWKDKNQYWGCPKCKLRFDGTNIPEVKEIKSNNFASARIMEFGVMKHY